MGIAFKVKHIMTKKIISVDTNVTVSEAADTMLSLDYISPEFINNVYSSEKAYKSIYIRSEGEISVDVYIEGIKVQTTPFTENKINELKVPNEDTRGTKVQFGITGTGTVYEIRFDEESVNG